MCHILFIVFTDFSRRTTSSIDPVDNCACNRNHDYDQANPSPKYTASHKFKEEAGVGWMANIFNNPLRTRVCSSCMATSTVKNLPRDIMKPTNY